MQKVNLYWLISNPIINIINISQCKMIGHFMLVKPPDVSNGGRASVILFSIVDIQGDDYAADYVIEKVLNPYYPITFFLFISNMPSKFSNTIRVT